MSCRMTSETNAADLNVVPAGRPSRKKARGRAGGDRRLFPTCSDARLDNRHASVPPFALETIDVWETKPKVGNPLLDPTTRL